MKPIPDWVKNGYLRLIDPVANWLVRRGVHPNTITIFGTLCTVIGGVIYGTGHIKTGGWFLGITALFDVLDGTVARRSGKSSTFGAFLDSTLDRLADGFLLGGLAVFYATSRLHGSVPLLITALLGMIGAFMTSYTRARAESRCEGGAAAAPRAHRAALGPPGAVRARVQRLGAGDHYCYSDRNGLDHRGPARGVRVYGHHASG
jgi:phosphatidylglycerophosphate synthase